MSHSQSAAAVATTAVTVNDSSYYSHEVSSNSGSGFWCERSQFFCSLSILSPFKSALLPGRKRCDDQTWPAQNRKQTTTAATTTTRQSRQIHRTAICRCASWVQYAVGRQLSPKPVIACNYYVLQLLTKRRAKLSKPRTFINSFLVYCST